MPNSPNDDRSSLSLDSQKSQPNMISVVIPTHNRLSALTTCWNALRSQTYPQFELVIVDDYSTDGTHEAVSQWAVDSPYLSITCLRNDTNLGANASRNRGIKVATGSLMAFLDSDCVPEPDWLEKLIEPFRHEQVASTTGLVTNPPPSNVYELAYKGTNRVHGSRYAPRLVGGNMCIRRELLLQHPLDEDLKYGCDEEGIYLRLKAAGHQQILVPEAQVLHDHRFTARTYFRQGKIGGAAAAWLVYKYHLPQRLDLIPFMLAYLSIPLAIIHIGFVLAPAFFLTVALAALAFNELTRKRKTVWETMRIFPVLIVYYQLRLWGYVTHSLSLRLGLQRIERVSLPK